MIHDTACLDFAKYFLQLSVHKKIKRTVVVVSTF